MKIRYEIRAAADHTRVDVAGAYDATETKAALQAAIDSAKW
ncbi:MAG TPA: hypothetical protein VE046_12615 [Steroidobacteraceae bacterium]|nr:hypothetical protein [Steroidobacteraceae bacterium]